MSMMSMTHSWQDVTAQQNMALQVARCFNQGRWLAERLVNMYDLEVLDATVPQ
jgi:hypothetical protein